MAVYRYTTITLNAFRIDHFYQYFLLLMDIILLMHNYITIVQMGMFSTTMIIITIYHRYTIDYVNRKFDKIASVIKNKNLLHLKNNETLWNSKLIISSYYIISIKHLFNLHGHICRIYMECYKEVWGITLYNYLILSLPYTIICILAITNNINQVFLVISIGIVFVTNTEVIISQLLTMAWQTKTLHETKKYLPGIIPHISFNKHWRLKLQIEDWFNRLNRGKKYGPYVPNIGDITFNKVLDVSSIERMSFYQYLSIFRL